MNNRHSRHADRADRYIKEHGLERKEDHKGVGNRLGTAIKNRYVKAQQARAYKKSPAGRREKIQQLGFEAKEEALKTNIHKSKTARRSSSVWGGNQSATHVTRKGHNRSARQQNQMGGGGMNSLFGGGGGDMGSTQAYHGMNDLLGGGSGMQKRTSKKQTKQYSGMDDLF